MLLLVVVATVPPPDAFDTTTVPPVAVSKLPCASFNWTVIVDVVAPSATIDFVEAVTVDVDAEAVPGVTEIKSELIPV